jgi:hypothetical protein
VDLSDDTVLAADSVSGLIAACAPTLQWLRLTGDSVASQRALDSAAARAAAVADLMAQGSALAAAKVAQEQPLIADAPPGPSPVLRALMLHRPRRLTALAFRSSHRDFVDHAPEQPHDQLPLSADRFLEAFPYLEGLQSWDVYTHRNFNNEDRDRFAEALNRPSDKKRKLQKLTRNERRQRVRTERHAAAYAAAYAAAAGSGSGAGSGAGAGSDTPAESKGARAGAGSGAGTAGGDGAASAAADPLSGLWTRRLHLNGEWLPSHREPCDVDSDRRQALVLRRSFPDKPLPAGICLGYVVAPFPW